MDKFTPLVYDDGSRKHRPAGTGVVMNPTHVAVDTTAAGKNILHNDADKGLSAIAADAISKDADNAITSGGDGGVLMRLTDIVSSDAKNILKVSSTDKKLTAVPRERSVDDGNYLRYGTDGGYFIGASDILSDAAGNPLTTSTTDGKILLNPCLLPPPPVVVSTEEGNLIRADRADDSAVLTFSDAVSPDAKNMIVKDDAGKLKVVAASVSSGEAGNLLFVDSAGRIGLRAADLIDRADACSRDNLLLLSADNKLEVGATLAYNDLTGKLDLLNGNGAVVSTVSVPTAPSILESVTLEDNPAGQPAGRYLHFAFRQADGTVTNTYVDVSSLKDVYTEGKGITLHGQEINVKLAPKDSGLSFDDDGCLQAGFSDLAGPGLVVTEDPTSLGKQFEVAVCDGLHLVEKTTTDGEDIKAVAVNIDETQTIVDLVDDPDGGCPKLSAALSLMTHREGGVDSLRLIDRNGNLVGTPITANIPIAMTSGVNSPKMIYLALDLQTTCALKVRQGGLSCQATVSDLLLGVNSDREFYTTLGAHWDDTAKEVVITGRESQKVAAAQVPVVAGMSGVGKIVNNRYVLELTLTFADASTLTAGIDCNDWFVN